MDQTSLVSGLSSAALHMLVLIGLGLVFANVPAKRDLELRMVLANTDSARVETLDVELEQFVERQTPTDQATLSHEVELQIAEPRLLFDLGNQMVSEERFDPASKLSQALVSRRDQASENDADRKGSFFGADAYGDEFVYVVDMSTSMGRRSQYGESRFRVACRELLRSIHELKSNQKFCVIMFCYQTRIMFDLPPRMISATRANKHRLQVWINGLGLAGGTDPRYGVMLGLQLKPDAIFLLSDGEFNGRSHNVHGIRGNPSIEKIIALLRNDAVPIHTIAFEDMRNRRRLRRIAASSGGTHRFVGHVSDQSLLLSDLRSRRADDVLFGMQCLVEGTRKLRDSTHERAAVRILVNRLTSRNASMREAAHASLVALSGEHDLGPHQVTPTLADFEQAQERWTEYWQTTLDERRHDKKGKLVSVP